MGIGVIFIAGTPFLNMPWQADSYSPLDFSLMDPHWGTISDWVAAIDAIHARGMYIMLDFTVGTMADLLGWAPYVNKSAPFDLGEYDVYWKHPLYAPWGINEYQDFKYSNQRNDSCVYPNFWLDNGQPYALDVKGCYASEFDQYGDMEAFGVHPDWQRQLSKFAGVQDRLREWNPDVMAKIQVYACLTIEALDIDAIRIDKSIQVSVNAIAAWATHTRSCAKKLKKNNFLITGEVTGGDTFGSLYVGRGRMPNQRPPFDVALAMNGSDSQKQYFMRQAGLNGIDAITFHYSVYRYLTRFLGMDGNLEAAYDLPPNFVTSWYQLFVDNDFLNPNTNEVDPKHMFGMSNFDVYRWPGLANGTIRQSLGTFITTMLMPGVALVYYGEEQGFYLFDNTASNYLFGRQAMSSSQAWVRHGCYRLGSEQYFHMAMDRAAIGCQDEWNSYDHFDPTAPGRVQMSHFYYLRSAYPSLLDGFGLEQLNSWTYDIYRPGSNGTPTEVGLWSVVRLPASGQNLTNKDGSVADPLWLIYTNENATVDYTFDCTVKNGSQRMRAPFPAGTAVRNLLPPFETYNLSVSPESYYNNSKAPWRGCIPKISLPLYGFKLLVNESVWVAPRPALTRFTPGHDARILSDSTSIDITLEFNTVMSCSGVTSALSVNVSSNGQFSQPTIKQGNCGAVNNPIPSTVPSGQISAWSWSGTLQNVPDGIVQITLTNAPNSAGDANTNAVDHLLLRKGSANNVMVFPLTGDYDSASFGSSGGKYTFNHKALGAERFRISTDFGQTWNNWTDWESTTTIESSLFPKNPGWPGQHLMIQYWSSIVTSSTYIVHADRGFGQQRRVPQYLARGAFNKWGFDKGTLSTFKLNDRNYWELEVMARWPTNIQLNVYAYDDYFYGDTDGDGVLDRLPPNSAAPNYLNMTTPPHPHLAWAVVIDDRTGRWWLEPRGRSVVAAIMYGLLLSIPLITATLAVFIFRWSFYGIKINQYGIKPKDSHHTYFPLLGSKEKDGSTQDDSIFHFGHSKQKDLIGWPEVPNKRRKVLIATMEYEIIDWKLKVKIGGLGVMSSLMGKAMTDVDLIWVIPKVKDLEYPQGEPAEPIEVIIFGQPYLIEVETHVLDNITYVILDSPVFRAQTKSDPYPPRMDDLSSAIYYSTWNQAIAATVIRFPLVDIYHINDYHGALVPLYLLPKVLPVCLSLHNAEFQGLWPLRTKEEMREVCSAFNISKETCTKYVQFGNTFNLLHAAASFIADHQKSIGVAGVSDKYGKRSWARYPALWTLKHVDSLPNPDPSDIEALDENAPSVKEIKVDEVAEAARPELKRQAQEWAGIAQDPNSNLFVFVGRWSKQKGVDLIADVLPGLLAKRNDIQVICVGPVIDLYGRFAAEKLARLMKMHPEKVFSKPEFTALPPFLFSGADFALIPSRDEPFGLVAVEFGRKGALGVGSRLGGLGLMPGWWFPVESTSTAHMLSQLSKTIKLALKSTTEERALLRARSAVQRFPVVEWRQKMEDFHRRSIHVSRSHAGENAFRESDCDTLGPLPIGVDHDDWEPEAQPEPVQPEWDAGGSRVAVNSQQFLSPNVPYGQLRRPLSTVSLASTTPNERGGGADYFSHPVESGSDHGSQPTDEGFGNFLSRANRQIAKDQTHVPDPFLDEHAVINRPFLHHRLSSAESITSIMDEKGASSPLNKAIASFTDADGEVAQSFVEKLQDLNAENSKGELSIEKFLTKSEAQFFEKVKKDKLSSAMSVRSNRDSMWGPSSDSRPDTPSMYGNSSFHLDEYSGPLPHGDEPPMTRLQILLQREIGSWPLYTIIIALGQMLSATSFQITLLSGQNWQEQWQAYVLGGIFLVASAIWYALFRLKPSVWILTAPWFFFALAFFLIGLPSISSAFEGVHKLLSGVATWSYAVASAAAFTFFGLNFGEEAGAATEVWALRACIVQGSQQLWVAALWYWGNSLNAAPADYRPPWWIVCILWPLSAMCLLFGFCMAYGLPEYYRQVPPKVPHFLKTLFRRKLVLWFLASEILRDYWLSGPYGRNWAFLWSAPFSKLFILALVLIFFILVWGVVMGILTYYAQSHTWLLAVFAVGLGAPRWCQILWSTSSLALYIPWAGAAGPYLGTSLWLWLGVLDAVQGVGLGMILLQTLSRLHVCATLAFSQVIGSIAVMVAHATAPNRIGPSSVFPDASTWDFQSGLKGSPLASAPFWLALICQLVIVVGYFWFYRKEQLARP
ncbi:modular protein with glycoside hydrolase family 13 and glycosyltransferase family 5 domains [Cantharellus anzutake]|uniref:modular protein with glycoside hydrolase family 13 and glycosyltransferase family 5 domains n=1 Tax=Cantharellus anzutake TaxID=1750568 RepID=UPI001904DDD4|nr:modular protein with glycoside hydrolase family 13 and glycosyltransferase family 5 domains [Cantharellus anzutake]KAF8334274.1 modular protein with glycoside hydrolase family 13 and glycosyltransferase family 5 domains [Cantharellus anzutake]